MEQRSWELLLIKLKKKNKQKKLHESKTLVQNYFLPVKITDTVDPIKEKHARRISEKDIQRLERLS